jgi:putative N6-adenine-specific DNA methylase
VTGGVAWRGRLPDLYRANLCLRTASRILMRVACFDADNFGQLERRLAAVPWELYLPSDAALQVMVTSHRSRLYHRDAVAQRVRAAIAARMPAAASADSDSGQRVYVLIEQGRCTLSLDSSGPLLHRRNMKRHGGRAPLRETLAAGILLLAGYRPGQLLVDPLCGSGTFAIEAAMMAGNVPAGMARDFAFTRWPAFSAAAWNHIRSQAARTVLTPSPLRIHASDRDALACQKLVQCLHANRLEASVQVRQADFFSLAPPATPEPGLVVINPPYGRRLGSNHQSTALLQQIAERLDAAWRGWRFAVLSPARMARMWPLPARMHALTNGGLAVVLHIGQVASGRPV